MHVYLNDQFIEQQKAVLHVSDLAILRGYNVFDFFRVRNNVLLYVEDHLDRFLNSVSIMHLSSPYPKEKLLSILHELVKKNNLQDSGIRMILTGGYSPDAYQPVAPNFIIMQPSSTLKCVPLSSSIFFRVTQHQTYSGNHQGRWSTNR